MSKRVFLLTVRGKQHEWCFPFDGEEEYWDEWLADGLDVSMVENIIPEWVVFFGLDGIWCKLQTFFRGGDE